MKIIAGSRKKIHITEEEVRLVRAIFDKTNDGRTLPIITFRGPETAELFLDVNDDAKDWADQFPALGFQAWRGSGNTPGSSVCKVHRYAELLYVGSPAFPRGVPVGAYDEYTETGVGSGSYRLQNSRYDVTQRELERLHAIAYGKPWMTYEEQVEQQARNARLRDRDSVERTDAAREMFAQVLSGMVADKAKAAEAEREQPLVPDSEEGDG